MVVVLEVILAMRIPATEFGIPSIGVLHGKTGYAEISLDAKDVGGGTGM
jgi:hypothetical protein